MKNYIRTLLCAVLAVTLACPAFAAEAPLTPEAAGAILREQGIYQGDGSGDLMLDKGLTRAELAMLLARLDDPEGEFAAYPDSFGYLCGFPDVPNWAKSAVGYCWNRGLVKGYDNGLFGAGDPVIPAAACTVVLRLYGHRAEEGSEWSYATACTYAVSLGLIGETAVQGATINRGDMAVLLCNAMGGKAEPQTPKPTEEDVDYSQEANPAVFTDELTQEVYNAYRDVVCHQDEILEGTYIPQAIPNREGLREVMDRVTSVMGNYPVYEQLYQVEDDSRVGNVKHPETFDAARSHTDSFIAGLEGQTGREKVVEIDWYICQRMTYSRDIVSPTLILAGDGITAGNCMSHAHSFIYLCGRAGIPCLLVSSETHQWNQVYLENQWWDVDVTGDDMDNVTEEEFRRSFTILHPCGSIQGADFVIRDPELNRFVRELLIPGSTK